MIQFNTFSLEFITIAHKNTLLTGCPVKRVHIMELIVFYLIVFKRDESGVIINYSCSIIFRFPYNVIKREAFVS